MKELHKIPRFETEEQFLLTISWHPQVLKSDIQIFRAADPGLTHVFHHVACDHKLDASQYQMCQGTRYSTYGAAHALVKTLLKNPDILAYKRSSP